MLYNLALYSQTNIMSNDDSTDDTSIFSQAMEGVKPLSTNTASIKKKPEPIRKRQQEISKKIEDTLSDEFIPACEDHLEFMRPGVQKSFLKQIRNGKVEIQDHLDLHGYRRDDARKTLLDFLNHAQQQSFKLVRIVHGKGYHSDDSQPVLKAMVNKWLQCIPDVLAFVSATARDGGTGAVYVLLKKRPEE